MSIFVDSSAWYAAADRGDRLNDTAKRLLATDEPLVTLGDAARANQGLERMRQLFHLELLNRGLHASTRGMFSVSTPMGEDELDQALDAIEGALMTLKPYIRDAAPRLLR